MTSEATTSSIAENAQLRAELAMLQAQFRQYHTALQRQYLFDLHLISARNFRALTHVITHDMHSIFAFDAVSLILIDQDFDIRNILIELQLPLQELPGILFTNAPIQQLSVHTGFPVIPYTGKFEAEYHQALFPDARPDMVTLIPLRTHNQTTGYLALGSHHPASERTQLPNDILERIGSVISLCLENVINHERLKHLGLTDSLTGIPNRRYLEQRMHEEIARAQRDHKPLACLYIDVDYFKQVNDTYGHANGDIVLRTVSTRIRGELRASDSFGRFGGEEFIVLLADTSLQGALAIGERIRASVSTNCISLPDKGINLDVSVSIGITCLIPGYDNVSLETLRHLMLDQADKALYQAKIRGRNQIVLHEEAPEVPDA